MSINAGKKIIQDFRASFQAQFRQGKFEDISKLLSTLDNIQEQPQLLDEYLEDLLDPVLPVLIDHLRPEPLSQFCLDLFHAIYYYSKIRGSKVIVKFLPNDVHLLEPVLTCLSSQPSDDHSLWQGRFILLLWLSLICMAPFDMRSFDATPGVQSQRVLVVDRILTLANSYIGASGREREAAGLLIARLLTRKDVNETYFPEFLDQSLRVWTKGQMSLNHQTGLLTCLCEIYKIGNRDILQQNVDAMLSALKTIENLEDLQANSLLKKLRVKLAQRLALCQLRPNRAAWRYQSTLEDMSHMDEESETEPSTTVEEVIGLLIDTMSDRDTIVRYTAAKGLGRITSRLDQAFAEEVITAILDLLRHDVETSNGGMKLKDTASESCWHGCCLALAELCRAGALLPSLLPDVLPFIFTAMKFDIKKGSHSIGTSVRDAACYVMWSMLRSYRANILVPFAKEIATSLIVIAMFDREVSVRRAASAAYQEGVGRQPADSFPNGIAVLSKADFFAVGQRRMSYLEVGPAIFQHEAYQSFIVEHLTGASCAHWDISIRELASETLGNIITNLRPDLDTSSQTVIVLNRGIQTLCEHLTSIDVSARHGSYRALGELCNAVRISTSLHGNVRTLWTNVLVNAVTEIPEHNFKGPRAPLMYRGVCHYVNALALLCPAAGLEQVCLSPSQLTHFYSIASNALKLSDELVRFEATTALVSLCSQALIDKEIRSQVSQLSSTSGAAQKGWITFYGKLSYIARETLFGIVVQQTVLAAKAHNDPYRDDPELRKIAVEALHGLIPQLFSGRFDNLDRASLTGLVLECLKASLEDYAVDARGDVGSWVREAAITSTSVLFLSIEDTASAHTTELTTILSLALAQCVGKIDNLRVMATQTIRNFTGEIEDRKDASNSTMRTICAMILPALESAVQHLSEGMPSTIIFQDLTSLLHHEAFRKTVFIEYLVSGSSGSQSTMKAASQSIASFLEHQSIDALTAFLQEIRDTIVSAKDDERVLVPLLSSTADLLQAQLFLDNPFPLDSLFAATQDSTINSRNMPKITAALRLYAALACSDQNVRHKAWKKISLALANKFPRVRVQAAELLYSVLSTLDLEEDAAAQSVVDLLTHKDWSKSTSTSDVDIVKRYILP